MLFCIHSDVLSLRSLRVSWVGCAGLINCVSLTTCLVIPDGKIPVCNACEMMC